MDWVSKYIRQIILVLSILFLGVSAYFLWNYLEGEDTIEIIIGSGTENEEAFEFAKAIAEISRTNYPEISIVFKESIGSEESMKMIESGIIDMALIQADVEANSSARIVANLYPDMYQLIVSKKSNINSFQDLKGKRIVLPTKGSGQWTSFWFIAKHYGIEDKDMQILHMNTAQAVIAINTDEVDAVFKVRAPHNPFVAQIIHNSPTKIIPIYQAAAMRFDRPSLKPGIIPMGTYGGSPLTPEKDIPTVASNRLLIAGKNANNEGVRIITEILFERRLELSKYTSLAGFISQPNWNVGTFLPIHEGARLFYDREKPSFFVENADFLALILTVLIGLYTISKGISKMTSGDKKNLADKYTLNLLDKMDEINVMDEMTMDSIKKEKTKLRNMLSQVIHELDKDRLTPEGFQFFSFTWNTVYDMLNEKEQTKIT